MKLSELRPMLDGIVPIDDTERRGRIAKAQRLMGENRIDAVVIEGGTGMFYFTGVNWHLSERTFAMVLPAKGDIAWVCPKFEEDRARELVRFGNDIRTWEEDESPFKLIADIIRDGGVRNGRVGFEETVRYFLCRGVMEAAPSLAYVSADPVTIPCRSVKSAAEIALMQRAMDITVVAYKTAIGMLREGMTKEDFRADAVAAFKALGVVGGIGAQIGEQSSLPHGSSLPRTLHEGDIVLMDGGCTVDGYHSDISRTIVFGKASARQREIWALEKRAQAAAFAAARPGATHESVDAAARKVITDAGFGPDYRVPGLPHRTGHGLGLDVHEWTYLVRGNTAPLEPGMCVTNEPMIVLPGEFGVRIEDDMYITEDGVRWFTQPSPSIEEPFV
jgi:Xaa-Pro dipeptidase